MINLECNFVQVPKIYRHLTGNEFKVFTIIFDEWSMMKNEDGWYYRSWNDLCFDCNLSNNGLNKAIKGLISKGLLSKREYPKKEQRSNDYKINLEAVYSLADTPTLKKRDGFSQNERQPTSKKREGFSQKESTSNKETTNKNITNKEITNEEKNNNETLPVWDENEMNNFIFRFKKGYTDEHFNELFKDLERHQYNAECVEKINKERKYNVALDNYMTRVGL